MKFAYQIDPNLLTDAKGKPVEDQRPILEHFVCNLFASKYPDGIKGSVSRKLDDFFRKLDKSTDGSVELETEEVLLLKEIFGEIDFKLHPLQTRYYHTLRRSFEEGLAKEK